jgi:hypothetical protein
MNLNEWNAIVSIIKNTLHAMFLLLSIVALIVGYVRRRVISDLFSNWLKKSLK